MNTFTIRAKLPSLNDVIGYNRSNKFQGNRIKQEIQELIGWSIKQALTIGTLVPITKPCEIYIEWHEATKKRDPDNVQSSVKFILDSMVANNVLINDNRRYIKQIYHKIVDDKDNFVVVRIEEV